jgi:hypothetical protein
MPNMIAKAALVALALGVASNTQAQGPPQFQPPRKSKHHYYKRDYKHEPREAEPAQPMVPIDHRDSVVAAPSTFNGRPYWLALAQCGGIYFKLNTLYTDAAVRARVIKPDPRANAEFTKKLNDAIRTATAYFDGAEHFLMTDRGIERADAVLAYDASSRAAAERLKSIDAALAAAKSCPALYRACQAAFPKHCGEPLEPTG